MRKRSILAAALLVVCAWLVSLSFSLEQGHDFLAALGSLSPPDLRHPSAAGIQTPVATQEQIPAVVSPPEAKVDLRIDGASGADLPDDIDIDIDIAAGSPLSARQRCGVLESFWGIYADDSTHDYASAQRLSDGELKAMADADDGYAQFLYAERLRSGAVRTVFEEKVRSGTQLEIADDESFQTMREYYIRAIRNHTRWAASRLAAMHYGFDRVESRAWWRIEEKMGGSGLEANQRFGEYPFTDQANSEGLARAEVLINEHDLTPGLSLPEECLTAKHD